MTVDAVERDPHAVPPWRDVRVIQIGLQVLVILAVGALIAFMAINFLAATQRTGLGFGFSFLGRQAGFEIGESLIPYSAASTYLVAFMVGLVNTLFVSFVGIVLATILGIAVGVARLSPNWLLARVAAGYVELMRNTPLLVQLVFLYFILLQLPGVRDSLSLGNVAFLNQRGLYLPGPLAGAGFAVWIGFWIAGVGALVAARIVARRREDAGEDPGRLRLLGLVVLLALPALGWFVTGGPLTFDVPVLGNFNFAGGIELSTGFAALLAGLVIYTAAFIGEVVRGGIQAVRRGQVEAARALGLSEGQVLRLVVFPQALRIIVPPLTSEFLNVFKNSAVASTIGLIELSRQSQQLVDYTAQPYEAFIAVTLLYFALNFLIMFFMRWVEARARVPGLIGSK